ncbi:hypothetical protein TELCIR_16120 [Teladorsagia circumcincta]|uniref:Uncharacterized protein n=1 Tax=Teladorsagia circumcincta TaxID=45464 RepID=A0A2G9TYM9_TELCI|nr:hypothetical protein TELCIR_16120 [Teladorsagia circumcincta]
MKIGAGTSIGGGVRPREGGGVHQSGASIGVGVLQEIDSIGDGVRQAQASVRRIRSIGGGVQHHTVNQHKTSIGTGVHHNEPSVGTGVYHNGHSIGSGVVEQAPPVNNNFHRYKTSIGDGVRHAGVGDGVTSHGSYVVQSGHKIGSGARAYDKKLFVNEEVDRILE